MRFPGQETVYDTVKRTGMLGGPEHSMNRRTRFEEAMGEQEEVDSPAPNYRDAEGSMRTCADCKNSKGGPDSMEGPPEGEEMHCQKYNFTCSPWKVCDGYEEPGGMAPGGLGTVGEAGGIQG